MTLQYFIRNQMMLDTGSDMTFDQLVAKSLSSKKYQNGKEIGRGNFGFVYRAVNLKTKKECAIKLISNKKLKQHPTLKSRVDIQIQILQKFKTIKKNPNIIDYYESWTDAQIGIFIVVEYCNEGNLQKYIEKNKEQFGEQKAISFLIQILNGFKGLHQINVIHRDIKLENILIHNGTCKIGDYGCSRFLEENQLAQTTLGSISTTAPQCHQGKGYANNSDIWSIGVIFYQMLHGKLPFQGKTAIEYYICTTKGKVIFNKNISQNSKDFIMQCLKVNPKERITWKNIYKHPLFENNIKKTSLSLNLLSLNSEVNISENDKFYQMFGQLMDKLSLDQEQLELERKQSERDGEKVETEQKMLKTQQKQIQTEQKKEEKQLKTNAKSLGSIENGQMEEDEKDGMKMDITKSNLQERDYEFALILQFQQDQWPQEYNRNQNKRLRPTDGEELELQDGQTKKKRKLQQYQDIDIPNESQQEKEKKIVQNQQLQIQQLFDQFSIADDWSYKYAKRYLSLHNKNLIPVVFLIPKIDVASQLIQAYHERIKFLIKKVAHSKIQQFTANVKNPQNHPKLTQQQWDKLQKSQQWPKLLNACQQSLQTLQEQVRQGFSKYISSSSISNSMNEQIQIQDKQMILGVPWQDDLQQQISNYKIKLIDQVLSLEACPQIMKPLYQLIYCIQLYRKGERMESIDSKMLQFDMEKYKQQIIEMRYDYLKAFQY